MYAEKVMLRKVAKRRMRAKVTFLLDDLNGYIRCFFRSHQCPSTPYLSTGLRLPGDKEVRNVCSY